MSAPLSWQKSSFYELNPDNKLFTAKKIEKLVVCNQYGTPIYGDLDKDEVEILDPQPTEIDDEDVQVKCTTGR